MENELIIILSVCILLLSFYIFRYAAGSMSLFKLNMVSYNYYVQLIIYSFIGATLVALDLSDHYVINRFPNHDFRLMIWGIIAYTILSTGIGMVLFQKLFFHVSHRLIRKSLNNFHLEWQKNTSQHDLYVLLAFSFVAILGVAYTYYYLEKLPWLYFLMGAVNEAAEARIQAGRHFAGIEYIKNILALGLTPILCYIAYCYKLRYKEFRFKALFYILFISSVMILIYNSEKAPILMFFIGFLMLDVLLTGRIKRSYFIAIGGLVFALVIGMYTLLGADADAFLSINSGPLGRIFQSQVEGMYVHFFIFPDIYPFLDGAGLPGSIATLLDFDKHLDSARMAMEYMSPSAIANGTAGVINTLFIGEAWANFGWIGVIIAPLIVGPYWNALYVLFIHYLPKHPFFMGFYAYTCMHFPLTGGFISLFINPGYWALAILIVVMYKMRNIRFNKGRT